MDGYPGNTACNSDAFIDQVGATVMHTQAASGLPNWHYLATNPTIRTLYRVWRLEFVALNSFLGWIDSETLVQARALSNSFKWQPYLPAGLLYLVTESLFGLRQWS